jgi:hypothetical protein
MASKRKRATPEERAERRERNEATTRLLEERIDYHLMKLKEERGLDRVPTREEFLADYEANLRERIAARGREAS